MKVLFLGCHCDDIELGCGATIHKRSDWDVHCCVFCSEGRNSEGELVSIEEISRHSLRNLGAEQVYFHRSTPDRFRDVRQDIWEVLRHLRRTIAPDVVVTQAADEHQDHVVLNEESIRVFRDINLLTYLSSYRSQRYFDPDTYEVVDVPDVEAKARSIAMYRQFYTNKNYLEDVSLMSIMRSNGIYIGAQFAEAYRAITRIGIT